MEREYPAVASRIAAVQALDHPTDGELVKLTVVHDWFEPGSTVRASASGGWPRVLSALKTLLETGDVAVAA